MILKHKITYTIKRYFFYFKKGNVNLKKKLIFVPLPTVQKDK